MRDTIKLFEVPVYGLSEQTLKKRVSARMEELEDEFKIHTLPEMHRQAVLSIQTYPMRNWEYNHIVGFIKISSDMQDMLFNIFLPYDQQGHLSRYLWWASRKHFVCDSGAAGLHFYLGNMKTNEGIRRKTSEMLYSIISEHIPKRYFVDTQVFDIINAHIDYLSLLQI